MLLGWKSKLSQLEAFDASTIEKEFKSYLEENAVGIGAVLLPFRLVVTGVGACPGMFDISAYLGQKEVVERMEIGLEIIQKQLNEK